MRVLWSVPIKVKSDPLQVNMTVGHCYVHVEAAETVMKEAYFLTG